MELLPIPIYDSLTIIKGDVEFRCRDNKVLWEVKQMLNNGRRFLGVSSIPRWEGDNVPAIVMTIGTEPTFFKEGGFYFEGNPIPHHVYPITIGNYVVYQVDVL